MDKDCPICNSCKGTRAQCRTKKVHGEPDRLPEPKKFADAITADHKVLNEDDESRDRDRVALVILDRFTKWLQSYAAQTKEANEVVRAFQRFVGPQVKPQHVYTDNSKEFIKALEELNWSHDTSHLTDRKPMASLSGQLGLLRKVLRVHWFSQVWKISGGLKL